MISIVERDAIVGNLLDRLEALEERIRILEATHPGLAGEAAGKLAYYREDDGRVYPPDDVVYMGELTSYKNDTEYEVAGFHALDAALTSTSWNGDAYSTTAKTTIDLSTVFGAPAGVKAVSVFVQIRDSGSAGGDPYLILSPENGAGSGHYVRAAGVANDGVVCDNFVVPCDANGDIYYQINATGAGTFDVWLEIWGYWI